MQFVSPKVRGRRVPQTLDSGVELEPAKFVDFLLEDTVQGVAFATSGACLVNLPDPARLAVHDLVVYGQRPISKQAKPIEPLMQAAALIEWHMDQQRVTHLHKVWHTASARGAGTREGALRGCSALLELYPALEPCFE